MPERYWLVKNIYSYEHADYYNEVIAIDTDESVIRNKLHDLTTECVVENGYAIYSDEYATVLRYGDLEVTFYILKEVTHFPK